MILLLTVVCLSVFQLSIRPIVRPSVHLTVSPFVLCCHSLSYTIINFDCPSVCLTICPFALLYLILPLNIHCLSLSFHNLHLNFVCMMSLSAYISTLSLHFYISTLFPLSLHFFLSVSPTISNVIYNRHLSKRCLLLYWFQHTNRVLTWQNVQYRQKDLFQIRADAFEVPMTGSLFSMVVITPKEEADFDVMQDRLVRHDLTKIVDFSNCPEGPGPVEFSEFPRDNHQYFIDVSEVLRELGAGRLFRLPIPDFRNLPAGLNSVGQMSQRLCLNVSMQVLE